MLVGWADIFQNCPRESGAVQRLGYSRGEPSGSKPTRTLQGMARVRSGQAPAWPLVF